MAPPESLIARQSSPHKGHRPIPLWVVEMLFQSVYSLADRVSICLPMPQGLDIPAGILAAYLSRHGPLFFLRRPRQGCALTSPADSKNPPRTRRWGLQATICPHSEGHTPLDCIRKASRQHSRAPRLGLHIGPRPGVVALVGMICAYSNANCVFLFA